MAANHTVEHIESLNKLRARIESGDVTLDKLRDHTHNAAPGIAYEQQIPVNHAVATGPVIHDFHASAGAFNKLEAGLAGDTHHKYFSDEIKTVDGKLADVQARLDGRKVYVKSFIEPTESAAGLKKQKLEILQATKETELATLNTNIEDAFKRNDTATVGSLRKQLANETARHTELIDGAKKELEQANTAVNGKLVELRKTVDGKPSEFTQVEQEIAKHEADIASLKTERAVKVQAKHDFLSGKEVKYKVPGAKPGEFVEHTAKIDTKVADAYNKMHGDFAKIVDTTKLVAPKASAVAAISGSASSLAEAHKMFNPFDGISADGLKSDNVKPLHEKFHAALAAVEQEPGVAGKLDALKSAHGNVKAFEAAKTAESDAGYKAAKEALGKAQKEVDEVLKVTDKSSKAVKDFAEASSKASKLQGNLGNYHAQGVLGAVKSNLNYKSAGNSAGKVFGRGAAIAAGAVMTLHAFQEKTSDGQDRSWVTRVVEGGAGLGLMAGGALVGKARI